MWSLLKVDSANICREPGVPFLVCPISGTSVSHCSYCGICHVLRRHILSASARIHEKDNWPEGQNMFNKLDDSALSVYKWAM